MILLYVSTFERVEKEPRTIAFYQICADKKCFNIVDILMKKYSDKK